ASFAAAQPTPAASAAPIQLDPFFEVRTPLRNYGPARLPGGRSVTPLARRLATEAGLCPRRGSPSGPPRPPAAPPRPTADAAPPRRRRAACRRSQRRAGHGALPRRAVR